LRNIRINGSGLADSRPERRALSAGAALHIENCTIFGFSQNAIDVNVNTAAPVACP